MRKVQNIEKVLSLVFVFIVLIFCILNFEEYRKNETLRCIDMIFWNPKTLAVPVDTIPAHYRRIYITGTEKYDNNSKLYIEDYLTKSKANKDQPLGLHIEFTNQSKWGDYIEILNMLMIADERFYIPYQNNLWIPSERFLEK